MARERMIKGRFLAKVAALALVLGILALGVQCGATPTPEVIKETVVVKETVVMAPAPMDKASVLSINFGTEPPSLDPALAEDNVSINILEKLFLGLTDLELGTNKVVPELATKWEPSDDGLTWTFTMRQDAVWVQYNPATGEITELGPVTAHDVVYGVRRSLDPETASYYSDKLKVIAGAEEYSAGEGAAEDVAVEAVDDYTVKFGLKGPAGYFPSIASMWVARPMPKDVIEEKGSRWVEPGFIVTNGPYLLKEWVHDDHLTLVKNPKYYDADSVQIEQIHGVMIREASTYMAMYEAGELDAIGNSIGGPPPLPDMDRIRADPVLSKELDITPDLVTYYYGFVNTKPPMDDPLVRKAFTAAIDRKSLVENVTKGGQVPATSFVAPGNLGAAAIGTVGIPSDCEQAKTYLADAGYPEGKGLPEIILMHNVSETHARIAQAIQAMWKDCLGVEVKIETQEWKVYLDTLKPDAPDEDKPHIYRLGWGSDYPDANNWLYDVMYSESGSNYCNWKNEEFDELVLEAQTETDPAKRAELYLRAETILSEEVAAIAPIYHYTAVWLVKPYVTKWAKATSGGEHIEQWELDVAAKKAALGQ